MEYFRLAVDMYQRKNIPIEYPCQILSTVCDVPEKLDEQLSRFPLFTYRENFLTPLPRSALTTDRGWGCLARTSQMLLAHTLIRHTRGPPLDYFRDIDDPAAPFSMHNLVRAIAGQRAQFQPVFWSPSQGCEAIRATVATANAARLFSPHPQLTVVVAQSGTVNNRDVIFRLEIGAVLLLVPVRVGVSRHITQKAHMAIEQILATKSCVGIVGGVPNRSYYIIGTSGHRLLYLDPHVATQPAFTEAGKIPGVHVEKAATLSSVSWDRIDTSLMFGFYLPKLADLTELCVALKGMPEELFYVSDDFRTAATTLPGAGAAAASSPPDLSPVDGQSPTAATSTSPTGADAGYPVLAKGGRADGRGPAAAAGGDRRPAATAAPMRASQSGEDWDGCD